MSDTLNSQPAAQEPVASAPATPVPSTAPIAPSEPAKATTATPVSSFSDQIPEEFRNEASLANIKDLNSLVKGYVHAQKEIGARVRIPGPEANEELKSEFDKKLQAAGYIKAPDLHDPKQRDAILNQLGRPETPDGYVVDMPEEVTKILDPVRLKDYHSLSHKLGLNKEQAKTLLEFHVNDVIDQVSNGKEAAREALQAEWGSAFDERATFAKDAMRHFEGKFPDAVAGIKNGTNPVVFMMAAELGKLYKEAGLVVGKRDINYGLTPDEARARIGELQGNRAHAYFNEKDPGHKAAVQEVERLFQAAYPEKGQS